MSTETPASSTPSLNEESKNLWKKASNTTAIDGSISRVCFSNLIIYTEDLKDEPSITRIIAEFIEKHPCRAILILAQPRLSESKLEVSMLTHTSSSETSRKNLSCEQITIRADGGSVKELLSAIQPLLVPDLPICLWWRGVFLTQKVLVHEMLSFATRFIYDGVTWTNLHYTVPQVTDYIERYQTNVGFTNFNWSRLRPWREYAADFFDSGMFNEEIHQLNRVRIEYMSLPGQEEGNQFRSLLFIAWLAVQLEWEPVQGKPGVELALLQFKNKKGALIETELALLPQTNASGQSIQKVIMGIQKENHLQEFVIERDHQEHLFVLSHMKQDSRVIFRKVPHTDSSAADLLFRELGRRTRNRVFEKSFAMASQIIQFI